MNEGNGIEIQNRMKRKIKDDTKERLGREEIEPNERKES